MSKPHTKIQAAYRQADTSVQLSSTSWPLLDICEQNPQNPRASAT